MSIMSDMPYKVDTYIVENGYCYADNASKKHLVETGMKKYMADKIWEIDSSKNISYNVLQEASLHDLAEILGEIIPVEKHDETMSYLTHYVLGVASFMQGYYITWFVEDDPAFISCPLVEDNQDGKWDKLVTHRNTSHVKTFDLALEHLEQVIALKDVRDKELMKTMQ